MKFFDLESNYCEFAGFSEAKTKTGVAAVFNHDGNSRLITDICRYEGSSTDFLSMVDIGDLKQREAALLEQGKDPTETRKAIQLSSLLGHSGPIFDYS